jgi:hypothetical protein
MKEIFLQLDFLGQKPDIYYSSKTRYRTIFGSLLTIMIGLLSILAFIAFGHNLLARKDPTAVYNKDLNENKTIGADEAFFLFAPHLPKGELITEFSNKFKMSVNYINTDTISPERQTNQTIILTVPLVKCVDTERYKDNYLNITTYMTLDNSVYWCVPDDFKYSIFGKQGTAQFAFWVLILEFCTNSTDNNNSCYSIDTIRSLHPKVIMQMITLDHFIDPKDYENPIKPIFNLDLNTGDTRALRNDFIYLKNTDVISDEGWIMESLNTKRTFQVGNVYNSFIPGDSSIVFQIAIAMENLKDVHSRKYLKLQEVIASAGGFIKMIMIIATFFVEYSNSKMIYESIYLKVLENINTRMNNNDKVHPNSTTTVFTNQNISVVNNVNISKMRINQHFNNKLCNLNNNNIIITNTVPNNINNSNIDKNYFQERKKTYIPMSICDILLNFKMKKNNILSIIGNDLKKSFSVENTFVNDIINKKVNKLIWGDNGYEVLKLVSLKEYFEKGINNVQESRKQYNIDSLLSGIQETQTLNINEILKKELNIFKIEL